METTKKAVIFDMDGVIFDTETLWKSSFYNTTKKFGIVPIEKFRLQLIGTNTSSYIKKIEEQYPGLDGKKFYSVLSENVETHIASLLCKKFKQYVEILKQNGYKIGLATGSKRSFAKQLFESIDVDMNTFFDATVCGEDVTLGKPNPQSYLMACEKLDVKPENAFVLEDSPNGIIAANSAGCKTIMVVDCVKPNRQLKQKTQKIYWHMKGAIKYILKQTKMAEKQN